MQVESQGMLRKKVLENCVLLKDEQDMALPVI